MVFALTSFKPVFEIYIRLDIYLMDGGDDWCLKKEAFTKSCESQKQPWGVAQCRYSFVRVQSLSFRDRISPSAQSDASPSTNASRAGFKC